jgi:hypothetical protein
MFTKKLSKNARRFITAASIAGIAGVGFGMAPAANAAAKAPKDVTVKVTQNGNYSAAVCVTDTLGGTCQDNVKKGQTRTFTVHPTSDRLVNVNIVVNGGGFAGLSVKADKAQLKFQSAGSKAKPSVKRTS